MLSRIFLVLFLVGVLFENVRSIPHKRDSRGPPIQIEDDTNDDLLNDMILKPKRSPKNSKHPREKRMAFSRDLKWPKNDDVVTINYQTSGVNDQVIQRAIEVFNAKTCIRFVPGSSGDYVKFKSGSSCSSPIGHEEGAGAHSISLSSGCAAKKGKVMHEMMHVLGFMHEHCRPDRDDYVAINTGNIISGATPNFAIQDEYVDLGIPYDCDSILHYKSTMASSNGEPTITSSHCSALGNGDKRLSLLDYKRVNQLYGCSNPTYTYFTVRVQTSSGWSNYGSGTDALVYLTLNTDSLSSTEFELDLANDESADLFESGSDDTFSKMAYRNDLGTITSISIRMVSTGWFDGWKPQTITVTNPNNNQVKTFTNSEWLYPSSQYTINAD